MANWTIALTAEQESALAAMVERWQRDQPDTTWTRQLVLEGIVSTNLQGALRELDKEMGLLIQTARTLTRAEYLPLIRELSGAHRERLRQLLGES